MGLRGPVRTAPAFAIGEDGVLCGAVFTLQPTDLPQPIYAYRHFLEAQGGREVHDT